MPIEINPNFQKALDIIQNTKKNLFITGKAGTGKSTLLKHIIEVVHKKSVVLAPTGLAAINVGGQTIHSFLKIPPGATLEEARKIGTKLKENKVIEKLELLIVDEVSMVRADLLDIMDTVLRVARGKIQPFGEVQMIFIGDLYQLPPVTRGDDLKILSQVYQTPYFFSSNVFNYLVENIGEQLDFIELTKIYRQTDEHFISLLNKVRFKDLSSEELEILNNKVNPSWLELDKKYIVLTARNDQATSLNNLRLEQLEEEVYEFPGQMNGEFKPSNLPTDLDLILKVGARVMFVKNDLYGKWVNGTLGTILEIKTNPDVIIVKLDIGKVVEVIREEWEVYNAKFDEAKNQITKEVVGSFIQFPLRLSWAITIHKSQGQTFDQVILDLGRGAFSTGQTYVALSRCRSLEGLVLARALKPSDIRTDYKVSKFLTGIEYLLSQKRLDPNDKLELIKTAIKEKQDLEITYLKAKNVKSKRKIKPKKVEMQNYKGQDFLALEAYCLLRKSDRVFNVDRIIEIVTIS